MDIARVLTVCYPGAIWYCLDNTYATLDWLDKTMPKPSLDELQAKWAVIDLYDYARLRAKEYPPQQDYLDAVFHQQQGDDSYMAAYWAKVEAVKAKYPKP